MVRCRRMIQANRLLKEFVEEVSSVSSTPASGGVAACVQASGCCPQDMLCKVIEGRGAGNRGIAGGVGRDSARCTCSGGKMMRITFSLLLDADLSPDETEAERFAAGGSEHAVSRGDGGACNEMIDNAFQALELMGSYPRWKCRPLSELPSAGPVRL